MTKTITIGVLGASAFAQRTMIPSIHRTEPLELAGVASRTLDYSNEFVVFKDYASLVADQDVDAIYIPLPNSLHYKWILRALNAGKHVLCEKPLCCELYQVEEVVRLAREKQLVLMENFHFRHHSQLQFVKDVVASGEIGDVRCVRSYFGFPPFPDETNIRYQKELGGGALLDAGAYPIRLMLELLGDSVDVLSCSLHVDEARDIDLRGSAHLSSAQGIDCFSGFGFDNQYQCILEIWGSLGMIYTDRIFTAPSTLETIIHIHSGTSTSVSKIAPFDSYVAGLEKFCRLIRELELLDSQTDGWEYELDMNVAQAKLLEACRMLAAK